MLINNLCAPAPINPASGCHAKLDVALAGSIAEGAAARWSTVFLVLLCEVCVPITHQLLFHTSLRSC
jgi:hypothetical protein